jgi:hypothetical protein
MTKILFKKMADMREADSLITRLRRRELTQLFLTGTLHKERFAGLTVSFVINAGWPARANEPEAYANLTE